MKVRLIYMVLNLKHATFTLQESGKVAWLLDYNELEYLFIY